MDLQALSLSERITVFSWYYIKKFFGHSYPKLPYTNDDGFEEQFRDYVFRELQPLTVSGTHDLDFGAGLETASGFKHEIDLIANWSDLTVVFELKNCVVDKSMVMVFHQKCLDFVAENPELLSQKTVERCFLTNSDVVDARIRGFCNLWGIRLIDLSRPPLAQCRMWLERLASHIEWQSADSAEKLQALQKNLRYIEDTIHMEMNHLVTVKSEGRINLLLNSCAKSDDFLAMEERTIREVTALAKRRQT